MVKVSTELKYTLSHEWVLNEGDEVYCVGITEYAQKLLGDIVFVDLPIIGSMFSVGENCAVIESVKAASDVYAPISGTIVAVNYNLDSSPELVNQYPYSDGWLLKIKASNVGELKDLLDDIAYKLAVDKNNK